MKTNITEKDMENIQGTADTRIAMENGIKIGTDKGIVTTTDMSEIGTEMFLMKKGTAEDTMIVTHTTETAIGVVDTRKDLVTEFLETKEQQKPLLVNRFLPHCKPPNRPSTECTLM